MQLLRFGIMRRLRRGHRFSMSLTFRCNISCPYCTTKKSTGKFPINYTEKTLEDYKEFIDKYPYRIQEISVTGGSPELHSDFVEIVKYILSKGIYVSVFTNLMHPDILELLPKSRRLIFNASYHHYKDWFQMSVNDYTLNYDLLKKNYRVVVHEIDKQYLPYSKLSQYQTDSEVKGKDVCLRVNPELKIKINCWDLITI